MKKFPLSASFLLGLVTVSLQAGEPVAYKQVAPPPPPLYGTGFYGAIDAGANVFQNIGDKTFHEEEDFPSFGGRLDLDLKLEPNHEVGVFGVSNSVTSLAQAWFVPPLRETSFTTALGPVGTAP